MKHMKIKLTNIKFAYEENGTGDTCLFLHGSRDRKEVFGRLTSAIKDYHMLRLDFRGHGETDKPFTGYDYNQFLHDIEQFLNYKKVETLNIIGHSLGAVLAILFALQFKRRVKKLVLMGAHSHFKPKFKRPKTEDIIDQSLIEKINVGAVPFFFLPQYKHVQTEVLANWSRVPPHVHKGLINMGHPDLRNLVGKIDVPTLLIFGEKDRISSCKEGRFLAKQIKNSKLAIISDTGHFMFMEKPKVVAQEILKFLTD